MICHFRKHKKHQNPNDWRWDFLIKKALFKQGFSFVVLDLTFINKLKKSNDEQNLLHKGHCKDGEKSCIFKNQLNLQGFREASS
jgi:hypothetical protein